MKRPAADAESAVKSEALSPSRPSSSKMTKKPSGSGATFGMAACTVDNFKKGWTVKTVPRGGTKGGTYREWISGDGTKYRTLHAARDAGFEL